jgi:YcxB-like protein
MSESVELHFRYTEGEYVSAIRTYLLAKRRVAFFVGIASVVTLLGLYFLLTQSDAAATLSFLVTGAFLFGLLATSLVILPHRRFQTNPQFHREYYLQFAEDGILFRTDQLDATLKWEIYTEALETEKFYLLSHGEGAVTVIPKRVFKSGEQQGQFEDMLRRKVTA